jgi:DNA-binding transcriptional regulator YiaG
MTTSHSGASAEMALSSAQQIALIEAFERGEDQALVLEWLRRYPHLSDAITDFMLTLRLLDGPEVTLDPALNAAIERGMARGLERAYAATPAPVMNLVAALQAAQVTKPQLAKMLHIGTQVVDKFVQGQIALASVPQRFLAQVAQALNASMEQVQTWANQSVAVTANLRRDTSARLPGADDAMAPQSFAEAVRACSPKSMSAADKTAWLQEVGE